MSNIEIARAPSPSKSANYFQSDNFLKGYLGTDLVKSLLQTSGYTVCHYGFEYTLPDVMSKRTSKTSNSKTGRRIRKSPDLLVYDDQRIMLAEVKMRLTSPLMFNSNEIEILQEFWNDAILVLIVPDETIFYAQKIEELEIPHGFCLELPDFGKLSDIFTRVTEEHISHYKEIALPILQIFMSRTQRTSFNRPMFS
jgi:hypothetical protein